VPLVDTDISCVGDGNVIERKDPDLMIDLKWYRPSGTCRRRTAVGKPLTHYNRRLEEEYPRLVLDRIVI
jgi:hypothetical protein